MNTKITHAFLLTLGVILLVYGCTSSTPSLKEGQSTFITVSETQPAQTETPTNIGLSIRETARVATVFALQTASVTSLPTHTPTQTPTIASTSTPKPVSKDDVLISYTRYGGDGADEITSCLNAYFSYQFVLYRDGRLIIFDKTHYLETRISQVEIESLLSRIDSTGISSVASDGDQYVQNAPTPPFLNGWGTSITIREKSIGITDMQSNYLIEPVTRTLDIIEKYKPSNLKPYMPESITLWVFAEQGSLLESFYPTPTPSLLNWSTDSIDLNNLVLDPITYLPQEISGNTLLFLMEQFRYLPAFRRVEQNGQYYLVLACPKFP